VIHFRDLETLDEDEEYLKRFYPRKDFSYKIKALTEYYKFHKDISRMFMLPICHELNYYHDKRRRI